MEAKITTKKYWTITAVLLVALAFNFFISKSVVIGVAFGLAYLAFYSLIAGSIFIAKRGWHLVIGSVFLLSIISIAGALAIYFYKLNDLTFWLILVAIPFLLSSPYQKANLKEKFSFRAVAKKYIERFTERQEPKINSTLAAAYVFLAAFCFLFLIQAQTFSSIQSPWQAVNSKFFLFYFIASATLLAYILSSNRTKLPLVLISLHAFLSTSVALIVYGVGYGFDPFIHQATEKEILNTGTINPKPLYYLGQYGIVIFLSKLTLAGYEIIDRLLVPVLVSLVLPISIFYVFSHWVKKNYALALAVLVLLIPYSNFIMTAPQNLANLFFIFTILLSLLYFRNQVKISFLYILAAATIAIHPLAGLPLLITVFLFHLFKLLYSSSYHKYVSLFFLSAAAFVLAMPLAFIANGSKIGINIPDPKNVVLSMFAWVDKYDLPLNIAYLIDYNKWLLGVAIILLGVAYLSNHKLLRNNAAYFVAAIVIFANFLITKYFITFPGIRDFDQPDFVGRLLLLSFYILLPFFLLGIYWIVKRLWQQDIIAKTFLIFVLSGAMTVSLYLSYPGLDQYSPSKFHSLSISDIKAVNYIEKTADPNHIVLANQMVGAAAIKTVGFKKYYNGQFFYSMPQGNPQTFYGYYLEMIQGDNITETVSKAMNEAGVDELYFVLNKYWNNSEKIAAIAQAEADAMYTVDGGEVVIFEFRK